jgi:hypothetical protein
VAVMQAVFFFFNILFLKSTLLNRSMRVPCSSSRTAGAA